MATFKAGNRQARINIIITDDDIYEGPEGFNFGIGRISNRYVRPCTTYRSSVTITDDERGKQLVIVLSCTFMQKITV